jgi:hypothetical protein
LSAILAVKLKGYMLDDSSFLKQLYWFIFPLAGYESAGCFTSSLILGILNFGLNMYLEDYFFKQKIF